MTGRVTTETTEGGLVGRVTTLLDWACHHSVYRGGLVTGCGTAESTEGSLVTGRSSRQSTVGQGEGG